MDIILVPLLKLSIELLGFYKFLIFLFIVLQWLEFFKIINTYNRFVSIASDVLFRLVNPALSIFKRFLPTIGGIDLSPIALIFFVYFVQDVLYQLLMRMQ